MGVGGSIICLRQELFQSSPFIVMKTLPWQRGITEIALFFFFKVILIFKKSVTCSDF